MKYATAEPVEVTGFKDVNDKIHATHEDAALANLHDDIFTEVRSLSFRDMEPFEIDREKLEMMCFGVVIKMAYHHPEMLRMLIGDQPEVGDEKPQNRGYEAIKCEICEKEFIPTRPQQLCCSRICRNVKSERKRTASPVKRQRGQPSA